MRNCGTVVKNRISTSQYFGLFCLAGDWSIVRKRGSFRTSRTHISDRQSLFPVVCHFLSGFYELSPTTPSNRYSVASYDGASCIKMIRVDLLPGVIRTLGAPCFETNGLEVRFCRKRLPDGWPSKTKIHPARTRGPVTTPYIILSDHILAHWYCTRGMRFSLFKLAFSPLSLGREVFALCQPTLNLRWTAPATGYFAVSEAPSKSRDRLHGLNSHLMWTRWSGGMVLSPGNWLAQKTTRCLG